MFLQPMTLCILALASAGSNMPPPDQQRLARDIYRELIEINTSYSTGATTPVAEAVAARFRAAGFPAEDVQVLGAAPHKMNVLARYQGSGAERSILLLANLDVVEALREDWSTDPFKLVERDGYFYGRGTGDDKAQAAIWVATLLRLKQEEFRPDRDLVAALTADEEGGGPTNGVQGIFFESDDIRFHGRDERLGAQQFYEGQTFLYELIKLLSSPRANN